TAENMAYLHQRGGRSLSVLPRTRAEDAAFRTLVRDGRTRWRPVHDKLSSSKLRNSVNLHASQEGRVS
ncbi:MAG TPA: hypothetical protein VKP69_24215, partial [Isosphaeraceae bacterium]|nr:hypothetical protein [Isosphaeraceae bacterium]